jgi:manganese efflux pump family protein
VNVGAALTLVALVFPLCLDTFAVSAALGVAGLPARDRLRVSLLLAGFEVAMPIAGLLLGSLAGGFIGGAADYAAIALLAALGTWILRPWQKKGEEEPEEERLRALGRATGLAAIGLGLSISLDELAMGVSLGLLRLPVVPALVLIGLQALVASQLGLRLGSRISERSRERSEKAAGIVLLLLAAFLLVVHLR